MNNPIIKVRQDSTLAGSIEVKPLPDQASSQDVKSVFDVIHGKNSIYKDKGQNKEQGDDRDDSILKKNQDQIASEKQEKIQGLADGNISQQTLADILAAQHFNLAKNVVNNTNSEKISALRSMEAKLAAASHYPLPPVKTENKIEALDKEKRVKDIDVDEESGIGAADGSDSEGGRGSSTFSLEPLLSTQAAIHQLKQQKNPDEERQGKGKGLLAELVEQLVDCLHVSERMRSDDWQIIIKLKSEILQGTQLHLENYGRKLSVKLIAGDKETFDMLMQERYDLQNVLRSSLDQDINVKMERV
jgi:hypothetical protein